MKQRTVGSEGEYQKRFHAWLTARAGFGIKFETAARRTEDGDSEIPTDPDRCVAGEALIVIEVRPAEMFPEAALHTDLCHSVFRPRESVPWTTSHDGLSKRKLMRRHIHGKGYGQNHVRSSAVVPDRRCQEIPKA